MYIMPEADGNWRPEAYRTLVYLFNNAKCILVSPRRKLADGYFGLMFGDNNDISRQLKAAGVVAEHYTM